jgi:hypothetical protein
MYKFITVTGSCGSPYDVSKCESNANDMLQKGYELVQVYQTTTPGCFSSNSSLVMVFKLT